MGLLTKLTFSGGVHPPEYKEFTRDCAIEPVPVPKQVAVPLSQHIGAPCKPAVGKKDAVRAGQMIGSADAFVSAPVHSPVNGTVKDIALVPHPVIGRTLAVIIDVDAAPEPKQPCTQQLFEGSFDPCRWTDRQICQAVHQAGIVGAGGAGFPTRVKIEPNPATPKETLIINGCECEPFITCDYRLMLECGGQVLAGIRLAARATGVKSVIIGIEDNKPEAMEIFRRLVRDCPESENIRVAAVRTKYPQGGERQLIKSLLNKTVPSCSIPPAIGVCVLNVATCAAIAEAVVAGSPMTHRVVCVTGRAIARPGNYYAPIGMSAGDLIEHCGGLTETAAKVVLGGPMMGCAIADMSTPLTKTSGALTFLTGREATGAGLQRRQTPCIRCGRCLSACPENLNPTRIAHAVRAGRLDLAQQYYLTACIECGCCSYVCPAKIEIAGYIKTGKLSLARANKKV